MLRLATLECTPDWHTSSTGLLQTSLEFPCLTEVVIQFYPPRSNSYPIQPIPLKLYTPPVIILPQDAEFVRLGNSCTISISNVPVDCYYYSLLCTILRCGLQFQLLTVNAINVNIFDKQRTIFTLLFLCSDVFFGSSHIRYSQSIVLM